MDPGEPNSLLPAALAEVAYVVAVLSILCSGRPFCFQAGRGVPETQRKVPRARSARSAWR